MDIQLSYLRRYISGPFRVYGWFNFVPSTSLDSFHYTNFLPIREHAVKLNILGDIICASARDADDIVVFLDGDAFPIAHLEPLMEKCLRDYELMAVQRRENNGDIQPHPSFCATRVGLWHRIAGDWRSGYKWQDEHGAWVTDVGGNLLKKLRDEHIDWYPLLRSNRKNIHPLFFGVYGDAIYHHGAGFRDAVSRRDQHDTDGRWMTYALRFATWRPVHSMLAMTPKGLKRRVFTTMNREVTRNNDLSGEIYRRIRTDPRFYEEFVSGE